MIQKKEVTQNDEIIQSNEQVLEAVPVDPETIREKFIGDLRGMPKEALEKLSLALTGDFTSNKVETRHVEEIPSLITVLTDIFKKDDDGNLNKVEDELGIWLDVIGSKGIVHPGQLKYQQRANINAIYPMLRNGVYHIIYETDPDTKMVIKDENGKPKIKEKKAVHLGIFWRNYNSLVNLAVGGISRRQQVNTLVGGYGKVSPITADSGFQDALINMFDSKNAKKKGWLNK